MNICNEAAIEAHEFSKNHHDIVHDQWCGCFYCLKIFHPTEITEWWDNETTAVCPYCGVDSVIGESSGFMITIMFLKEMHDYWFTVQIATKTAS